MTNLDSTLKSRDITLPTKVLIVTAMVNWTIKKAWRKRIDTVVLEKTLESPLDTKEVKPTSPKRNQP